MAGGGGGDLEAPAEGAVAVVTQAAQRQLVRAAQEQLTPGTRPLRMSGRAPAGTEVGAPMPAPSRTYTYAREVAVRRICAAQNIVDAY